ncbi:hypothetical protein [Symbioplanes lichenis]|uniref:hypothetical protein n=1 Tax=Symbioplanes lichenis TaxID=1629072 RepID=UPI00273867BD|nr:hypothetical protein [Actinoplanes lichenis]
MGIRFTKLHSSGQGYLVVNAVDSRGEDGKDLALALCGNVIGGAGLITIRNEGLIGFRVECFQPDGSPVWPDPVAGGPFVACAAYAVRDRYGSREPVLVWQKVRHLTEVQGDTVRVTAGSSAAGAGATAGHSRSYFVVPVLEGVVAWPPPRLDLEIDTATGHRSTQ